MRRFAQQRSQLLGGLAHAGGFGAGDVQREHLRAGVGQQAQGGLVGVALPDAVEAGGGQTDGSFLQDAVGQIIQNAVTQVHCVVQPVQRNPRAERPGRVLEHAFPPLAGHTVFADGLGGGLLRGAAAAHRDLGVQVSAGKHNDAAVPVSLGHPAGQPGIHGPGSILVAVCSKFFAGHVNDVFCVGQAFQHTRLQQVGADQLHTAGTQQFRRQRVAEARHRDHAAVRAGRPQRVFGQRTQGRAHLAPRTQHQNIAVQRGQLLCQRRAGGRQHGVQFFFSPHSGFLLSDRKWQSVIRAAARQYRAARPAGSGSIMGPAPHRVNCQFLRTRVSFLQVAGGGQKLNFCKPP